MKNKSTIMAILMPFVFINVAFADFSMVNPVTGNTETYVWRYVGSDGVWADVSNWEDSDGGAPSGYPALENGNNWDPVLFSGPANVLTDASYSRVEGWELKLGLYDGANVTIGSLKKLQYDDYNTEGGWITVDGTSKLTISKFEQGNVCGTTVRFSVANENGITWNCPFGSGSNTYVYYFAGAGSVSYGQLTGGTAHIIKMADITLSGNANKSILSKTLVSFAENSSCTFTADAIINIKDTSGALIRKVELAVLVPENTTLTKANNVGKCELVQTSTGIVLYYVDGDPTATPTLEVRNVVCQQQYPWNGKVDIDYEVVAEDPAADVWVYATGFDKDANVSMGVRAISGDGAGAPVKPGKHRMTWDVTSDYPGFKSTAFTVKMTALTGGAPYMVVDLSGGVDALSYPVSYLSSVPAGGWTDEYKTTKLVLRLIPPGTFMMGSPSDELGRRSNETLHQVTLTKSFYIGVFELTQKQWLNVMGTTKGGCRTGDIIPANGVSYNDIRGSVSGAAWPANNQVDANSFMGRLRSKVNMLFDLPTESQWEYACRAGTGAALNNGKDLTTADDRCANLDDVAWYYPRSGNVPTTVGNFSANAWGLYDMHGNVYEWCLDWMINDWGASARIDPHGATSASSRVLRGGGNNVHWGEGCSRCCRSAARFGYNPTSGTGGYGYEYFGFRVICLPAE